MLRRLLPGAAHLRNYRRGRLRPDLLAGLAVWAVLVPQGLPYGELAGLPPTAVLGRVAGHQTWRGTDDDHGDLRNVPGLLVYRFDAPLFFADADVLHSQVVRLVDESPPPLRTVVLDAEGMVDAAGPGAGPHVPAHHTAPAGPRDPAPR